MLRWLLSEGHHQEDRDGDEDADGAMSFLLYNCVAMFLGAFFVGMMPLMMDLGEGRLKVLSIFSAGLMVGTCRGASFVSRQQPSPPGVFFFFVFCRPGPTLYHSNPTTTTTTAATLFLPLLSFAIVPSVFYSRSSRASSLPFAHASSFNHGQTTASIPSPFFPLSVYLIH